MRTTKNPHGSKTETIQVQVKAVLSSGSGQKYNVNNAHKKS